MFMRVQSPSGVVRRLYRTMVVVSRRFECPGELLFDGFVGRPDPATARSGTRGNLRRFISSAEPGVIAFLDGIPNFVETRVLHVFGCFPQIAVVSTVGVHRVTALKIARIITVKIFTEYK